MSEPVLIPNEPERQMHDALEPWADFIFEAENWLDGKEVQDEKQLKAVDRLLRECKAAKKALADQAKAETKPLHDAWKSKKAEFKPHQDDIERIVKGLAKLGETFRIQLAKEKEDARRKAQAEAEAARQKAREAEERADASNIEQQREAALLENQMKAAQAKLAQANKEKVTGLRTVTRYEITNPKAAVNWIAQNDKPAMGDFIAEYVRRNHKTKDIAGVTVWTEKEAF